MKLPTFYPKYVFALFIFYLLLLNYSKSLTTRQEERKIKKKIEFASKLNKNIDILSKKSNKVANDPNILNMQLRQWRELNKDLTELGKNMTITINREEETMKSTENQLEFPPNITTFIPELKKEIKMTLDTLKSVQFYLENNKKPRENKENQIEEEQDFYLKKLLPNPDKITKKHTKMRGYSENSFLFYNTLSLIMLALLAGGLVGVIFVLYFSFKN
jgi:hypothetical protein